MVDIGGRRFPSDFKKQFHVFRMAIGKLVNTLQHTRVQLPIEKLFYRGTRQNFTSLRRLRLFVQHNINPLEIKQRLGANAHACKIMNFTVDRPRPQPRKAGCCDANFFPSISGLREPVPNEAIISLSTPACHPNP